MKTIMLVISALFIGCSTSSTNGPKDNGANLKPGNHVCFITGSFMFKVTIIGDYNEKSDVLFVELNDGSRAIAKIEDIYPMEDCFYEL